MPKIVASRKDWVSLGYRLFSNSGEKGINVEAMARSLKCNKSSFYWHFKSRTDFIHEIIRFWTRESTYDIVDIVMRELSARDRFIKLLEISFQKDPNIDFIFYLKKYGQKHRKIEALVDKIDRERIDFVAGLLDEMGVDPSEVKIKARVFYNYLIGYHEMIKFKPQPKDYVELVRKDINQFIKL